MLFAASISTVASMDQEAGNATFDLGDGYEASFMLPDIGKSYIVEDAYAESTTENSLFKPYGFTISADGIDLASVTMYVYSSPQLYPVPKAITEASSSPDTMGPRVITPKTISGALGYVGYDLQVGATGTDTSNAMTGFFECFPGAQTVSDRLGENLESLIAVSGETGEFNASAQSLQVFNSLVDSIMISGLDN